MNELLRWLMGPPSGGPIDTGRLASPVTPGASSHTRAAGLPVTEESEMARLQALMAAQAMANLPQGPPGQAVHLLPDIPIGVGAPQTAPLPAPATGAAPPRPPMETPMPPTIGQPIDAMSLVRTPAAMTGAPTPMKLGIDPDKALLYAVLLNQVRSNMETSPSQSYASPFGVPQSQLQAVLVQRLLSEMNPASPVNTAVPTAVVPVRARVERLNTVDASRPAPSGQPKTPKGR